MTARPGPRRVRSRHAGIVTATSVGLGLLTACSAEPGSTTNLSVTSDSASIVSTSPGTSPGSTSSSDSRGEAFAQSELRPVLKLSIPDGWQSMSVEERGQAWVGVRSPALVANGYQPNVIASALNTDQDYDDVEHKPVQCRQPSAGGVTDVVVLGHQLQEFRGIDSCVSDAEYTISNGLRVHELNVVFATREENGKAALVQLAGRTSQASWDRLKPQVQQVMESLTVTP